jgi:hypothetical protein
MNFAGYFASKSVEPEIRKRLFRPGVIPFGNYIATYETVFHFGCAFGVTFGNHKSDALRLYSKPGGEDDLLKACALEVSSIKEVCDSESTRMVGLIHGDRIKALDEVWNTLLPADGATDKIAWAFVYGTVLGSQKPDLVERTWLVRIPLEEAKRTTKKLLREWLVNNKVAHEFLTDYFNTHPTA